MTIPGGVRAIAGKATGRFYFEAVHQYGTSPGSAIGVADATASEILGLGADTHGYGVYPSGAVYHSGVSVGSVTPFGLGDTVGLAVDVTSKLLWARVNAGVWNADPTADPGAGMGGISIANLGTVFPMCTVQALSPVPVPPTPVPPQTWQAFAMSTDGTKMVGVANGGYVWTSADTGATWTQRTAPGSDIWNGCAASSDGTKLIVCSGPGPSTPTGKVWVSTDSGANWTEQTAVGLADWSSVACSTDFTHLAAVDFVNGFVWTSADSGANWTQRTTPGDHLFGIASSSDGLSLLVTNDNANGTAYTSTDQGANWTTQTVSTADQLFYAASSTDGMTLYVSDIAAAVWQSTDGGANWTQSGSTDAPDGEDGMACSADGSVVLAVGSQNIWVSANSGGAWSNPISLVIASGAAVSSTGAVMVTGDASTGLIRVSTNSGATWASVNPTP